MNDKYPEKSVGVLNLYFSFNSAKLLLFLGIVVLTALVVTGIYVSIFGFDNWKSNMSQAGSLMLANFPTPLNTTGNQIGNGTVADSPNALGIATTPVQSAPPQGTTNQYICPYCGPVGLPNMSTNGVPLCPSCGMVMGIGGQPTP